MLIWFCASTWNYISIFLKQVFLFELEQQLRGLHGAVVVKEEELESSTRKKRNYCVLCYFVFISPMELKTQIFFTPVTCGVLHGGHCLTLIVAFNFAHDLHFKLNKLNYWWIKYCNFITVNTIDKFVVTNPHLMYLLMNQICTLFCFKGILIISKSNFWKYKIEQFMSFSHRMQLKHHCVPVKVLVT